LFAEETLQSCLQRRNREKEKWTGMPMLLIVVAAAGAGVCRELALIKRFPNHQLAS